ncbi:XRE family transcriptional regulator [Streptomyces sp. NPDC088194]|uniref:telomere-protecting terminal protein Tpg n=1 Tax=Streptomyces sp. NPDC088194 TaxID=3154931 RepID=UPI00344BFDDD
MSSLWPARLSPQAAKILTELPPHAVEMLRDVLDIAGRDPWTWPPMDAGDVEGEDVRAAAVGQLKRPQKALRAALEEETARDWQPGVRARVREQAASSGGLLIEARARFGFRAALGSTDDPRIRLVTQTVSPDHAGRILAARERGATEAELHGLVAEALGYAYFQKFGERAQGPEVVFSNVEYIDFRF